MKQARARVRRARSRRASTARAMAVVIVATLAMSRDVRGACVYDASDARARVRDETRKVRDA